VKFLQVSIGERFQYRGVWLRKIDALTAIPEEGEGGRRMIPRSAEVRVAGSDGNVIPAPPAGNLDDAFGAFRERLHAALGAAGTYMDENRLQSLRSEIDAAADALRAAVDKVHSQG